MPQILPPRSIGEREASAPASPSRGPGNGILRAETGGRFWAQNSENGRNTVRRPRRASLTRRNREGFYVPGNRPADVMQTDAILRLGKKLRLRRLAGLDRVLRSLVDGDPLSTRPPSI